MHPSVSRASILLLLATFVACVGPLPPPPEVTVTSPQRGLIQSDTGRVMVTGNAHPGPSGSPIAKVTVNGVQATLAADGSFTAMVDVPAGAMLLKTVAMSEEGATATDARAVHVGQLRPVGSNIERAVTAALSADAFAKLAATAGPIIQGMDLMAMLAPLQPMANLGDEIVNAKVSITRLAIGDVEIGLVPVDGGLELSARFSGISVGATAAYGGILVPDGSTNVNVTADAITIAGTIAVTPAGTVGFTTKIAAPKVTTAGLKISASGTIGDVLDLLNKGLGSTIQGAMTKAAEGALQPMISAALGALAGPQQIDVVGKKLMVQASPSAVQFSRAGALVTLNLSAMIQGAESSPGYIYTANGMPALDPSRGVQLALSDDLLNEMLAEIHALGLLDIELQEDFGLFDAADFNLTMPPMISANTGDGSLRLVLGDMVATFSDGGKPVITAALNASVDVEVQPGNTPEEIGLQFGKIDVVVNVIDGDDTMEELFGAASTGIAVQLDSLSKFFVHVPVPAVAGLQLDNLTLRGDSGYAVIAGQIH